MVISTFLSAIFQIASLLINAYIWILIAQSLISILKPDFSHPVIEFLNRLTIPLYQRIRQFIPPINQIDFSPLFAIVALKFIDLFFIRLVLNSL